MCRFIIVECSYGDREIADTAEAEGEAQAKALAFADANHGTTYEVYQIIGTAKTEPRAEWKGAKP
jgi:hypothetical protein